MNADVSLGPTVTIDRRIRILEARWQKLCDKYLPRAPEDSIWRYSAVNKRRIRSAGWKLHVSATILNAPSVLKRIAPVLAARGASFKAPRSLLEIGKLNSGLNYRYSQIGKVVTVYPCDDDEAVWLAQRLHELTKRLAGPAVPFDLKFGDHGNVYYRYGAFEKLRLPRKGRAFAAVYAPGGELVPDIREQPKPDWVADPFETHKPKSTTSDGKSQSRIRVLKVLVQRGKGGVYIALDSSSGNPRLCLLKEGRRNGELTWDGRDGAWRVSYETQVLSHLSACGVPLPQVLSSFEVGRNFYLLMEFLEGQTLHEKLISRSRRLTVPQVLTYGIQIAQFIEHMHKAGWVWRDCKPKNLIVTHDDRLVPIDFEGATPVGQPDPLNWGTPGFTPPEVVRGRGGNGVANDLYALGSMLFLLLTGKIHDPERPVPIKKFRRNVPAQFCELVESLLADEAERRPTATVACTMLTSISRNLGRSRRKAADA